MATDLDARIRVQLAGWRLNVESLREHGMDLIALDALMQAQAAILAVLDRHKPGYPDGPEYEEHDEPVFDRTGTPQGHVRVKGDPIPGYYCETCRKFSPCETVKDIARALGIEVV